MKKRFRALDALRGLFALMIVFYHMDKYSVVVDNFFVDRALIFVDYFFVLSGFVIMHNYHDKLISQDEVKTFTVNRFWRLYPLHLFCILILVLLEFIKYVLFEKGILNYPPFTTNTLERLGSQLLLLNSMGLFFGENFVGEWNYPSWSISGEFFSYLIFGIVLFMFKKRISLVIYVTLFFIIIYIVLRYNTLNIISTTEYGLLRAMYGFFIGVLVYEIFQKRKIDISKYQAVLLQFGVIFSLLILMYFWGYSKPYSVLFPLVFGVGILAFTREDTFLTSPLLTKPLQKLGERSYSIYMIHAIILQISVIIIDRFLAINNYFVLLLVPFIIASVTVLISGYTYKYIELYFYMRFKKSMSLVTKSK